MGQSLFNFAHPKDHDELRKNLKYQDETPNCGTCKSIVHFPSIFLMYFLDIMYVLN